MRRRVMLFGGWALATLAATGVGLVALGRVTDQVSPSEALPPPAAPVALETAPPATPPDPSTPNTAPSTSRPSDGGGQSQTEGYELTGGVVTVRYVDGTTTLVQATPRSGYEMDVKSRGPAEVEVRFRSDAHESRFVALWRAGAPVVERDERAR